MILNELRDANGNLEEISYIIDEQTRGTFFFIDKNTILNLYTDGEFQHEIEIKYPKKILSEVVSIEELAESVIYYTQSALGAFE